MKIVKNIVNFLEDIKNSDSYLSKESNKRKNWRLFNIIKNN